MTNEQERDPIEGFQVTGYDPVTGELTIEIHNTLLKHKPSAEALRVRAVKIMTKGEGVNAVTFVPRSSS